MFFTMSRSPVALLPAWLDRELEARLGIPLEELSLKTDVSGLKEKIGKAASMEAPKAEVEKTKGT
jgi:hypothetical protein